MLILPIGNLCQLVHILRSMYVCTEQELHLQYTPKISKIKVLFQLGFPSLPPEKRCYVVYDNTGVIGAMPKKTVPATSVDDCTDVGD